MQGIILAAGCGSRLASVLNGKPKCLARVEGIHLIEYQLAVLKSFGITDVCLVLGYQAEQIMELVGDRCHYIINQQYAETNSLYSLWLTRKWVKEEFLLVNSDLLAHPQIYKRILTTPGNVLAYDSWTGTEEEQMTITLEDSLEPIKLDLFFQIFADPHLPWQEAKIFQDIDGTGCITTKQSIASQPLIWQADLAIQLKQVLICDSPPVFLIPDWQTVVWLLPNAPNLKELEQLLDPVRFCQLLNLQIDTEDYPVPKLFRYVPLKRALLTWEHPKTGDRYFAKLCNDLDYPGVIKNFKQVAEASREGQLGFAVPQLVSHNDLYHTILMTEVVGCQFTEIMRYAIPESFAQVGRVLAQLHSSYLFPAKIWTADKELAIL